MLCVLTKRSALGPAYTSIVLPVLLVWLFVRSTPCAEGDRDLAVYCVSFMQPEDLEQGWFRECHLVSKGPVEVLILHKDVSDLCICLPLGLPVCLSLPFKR